MTKIAAALSLALSLLTACSLYVEDEPAAPDAMPTECELACEGSEDENCVLYCMKCEEAATFGEENGAQCCADLDAVGPACE